MFVATVREDCSTVSSYYGSLVAIAHYFMVAFHCRFQEGHSHQPSLTASQATVHEPNDVLVALRAPLWASGKGMLSAAHKRTLKARSHHSAERE